MLWSSALRAAARMAAFMPGASPPLVRMAMLFIRQFYDCRRDASMPPCAAKIGCNAWNRIRSGRRDRRSGASADDRPAPLGQRPVVLEHEHPHRRGDGVRAVFGHDGLE